jgi:hypothetical protein
MAQAALECANIALTKIGAAQITDLAGTEETAKACNLVLDPLRKSLLRMHPWNFAVKRDNVEPTFIGISNATDSGGLIQIQTASNHGWSTGNVVTIEDVDGVPANGTWTITVVDADEFTLDDSTFSGTYTASDDDQVTLAPDFGFAYQIAIPSDCLRILRVNEVTGANYRIERNKILTDDYPVELKYVYDVTTYTEMDVEFYQILATGLAADICYRITQSSAKEAELKDQFKKMLSKVRFDDASEDPGEVLEANDWIDSRFSYNG